MLDVMNFSQYRSQRSFRAGAVLFFVAMISISFAAMQAPTRLVAQVRVSAWQTYSSMLNIRATASDRNGTVWAGTSGGVFSYNPSTNAVQEYRNVNALLGLDITALAIHPTTGDIYAGGFNGVINIFDGKNWRNITDVLSANTPRKQINSFLFIDNLVFIGGEFGLIVFDPARNVITETVQRFGALQPNLPVKQLLLAQNRIWAATDGGVVSAQLGSRSYVSPALWTIHPLVANNTPLTQQAVSQIAVLGTSVYAVQDKSLWQMRQNRFDTTLVTAFEPIVSMQAFQNQLYYASQSRVWRLRQEEQLMVADPRFINGLNVVQVQGMERLSVNTTQSFGFLTPSVGGMTMPPATPVNFISLNSPLANRFRSLTVDKQGGLWCVSGAGFPAQIPNDGGATGISLFENEKWSVFNVANYPQMRANTYYQIDAQPDGSVWAANFGRAGVLQIERTGSGTGTSANTGFRLTSFTTTNSTLSFSSGEFIVTGQVRTDERGVLSMPNFLADSLVIQRDAQGRFYKRSSPILREKQYIFQAIDRANTRWFATWRGTQILAYNDNNTLSNPNDDIWYYLPSGLIEEGQSCIVADKQDFVWIGTPKNLYAIINPGVVLNTTSPVRISLETNRALADQSINAIAVDALNYKWIGTNNGVWVLDEVGGKVLAQFTTQNSPLTSNSVFAIAIDDNSGKVYFGTDNGLSVAQTLSVKPNADFSALRCFPQPFVPQQDNELVIDGLAENSEVKISTIDGILVRSFAKSNSRTVVWDGFDNFGRAVQSGVFVISAYSEANGTNAVVKAMVIQK
ncbi:MAG: hypothetical protein EAZ92_05295 [Candidatus Kapaibacterium sp.]|nr:MAG: hypothetical protein EAZ92_05295 [Candidatus Kapabacteria bacterium]